jgi:hypothetical protein
MSDIHFLLIWKTYNVYLLPGEHLIKLFVIISSLLNAFYAKFTRGNQDNFWIIMILAAYQSNYSIWCLLHFSTDIVGYIVLYREHFVD